MPLNVGETNIFSETRTSTPRELHECPHIVMTLPYPWDPDSVRFPQASRSVQEEVEMRRSNIGAIDITRSKSDDNRYDNPQDSNGVIFDLDTFTSRIISSAKVTEIPRVIYEVKVHDVPAARTFESKNRHTDVSAEDLSELWHIGVGQVRETIASMGSR